MMKSFSPLLAWLGVFVVACGFDFQAIVWGMVATGNGDFAPVRLAMVVFPLVWAALMGLFVWWTWKVGRNVIVPLLLIVIGIVVHLAPLLLYARSPIIDDLSKPNIPLFGILSSYLGLTVRTGTLTVLLGITALFSRKIRFSS